MKIIELLKQYFGRHKYNTGNPVDDRTLSQSENAYDSRELVTAYAPNWRELTEEEWRSNDQIVKRQWYTGECVAQSVTKHLGINNLIEKGKYEDLSAEFVYYFRNNKSNMGMGFVDATSIVTKKGACKHERIRQRIRESEPETIPTKEMLDEALLFRGKISVEDKERTMDSIARIIDTQGSCVLWFWFDEAGSEWWSIYPSIKYPKLSTYDTSATRHSVLAIKYGTRNGKRLIRIVDSAGNNSSDNEQGRYIDENYLKRCFLSFYVTDLPNTIPDMIKPKFTGNRVLYVGMKGDDVKQLQDILKYESTPNNILFPSGQASTGYFGGLTRAGVIKYQEKHSSEILIPANLTRPTGIVGQFTLDFLHKKYG